MAYIEYGRIYPDTLFLQKIKEVEMWKLCSIFCLFCLFILPIKTYGVDVLLGRQSGPSQNELETRHQKSQEDVILQFKQMRQAESDRQNAEIQKLQDLLKIAQTTPAKYDKPQGKFFNIIHPTAKENADFERIFLPMYRKITSNTLPKNPIEQASFFSKMWKERGYSYDNTFYHAFKDLAPRQYLMATNELGLFMPFIEVLQKEDTLKEALANGVISRASAEAYFQTMQKVALLSKNS